MTSSAEPAAAGPVFAHDQPECTGVLVTNLGTPDAPTPAAVRRYLAEFLWDPRVVDMARVLWGPILHGFVLRVRPQRSARAYAKVWTPAGSPLLAISKQQAAKLQHAVARRFAGPVRVALAMRYGTPSIAAGLTELRAANAQRILVLPLYPQYSASTTGSTFDAVADVLKTWRRVPELRMVSHYHDDPAYIDALVNSVRAARAQRQPGERLLFSFHGLPERFLHLGDPYHCECHKTARLVAQQLGLRDSEWYVAFQSRFGREQWLKPYTDHTLREWAAAGVKSVDVICPGFSADCLETLEEIAMENRHVFLAAGGEKYDYIAALNDSDAHIAALCGLIHKHTQGWPECAPDHDAAVLVQERAATRMRACDRGAAQ